MGLRGNRSAFPARRRGFTLIELLMVLAIAAIITVFAAPEFSQFLADQRVRVVTSDIFNDLLYARSVAINDQRRIVIEGLNGTNWTNGWRICIADPTADPARYDCTNTPETLRAHGPVGGRIKTCGAPASLMTARIAFRPDGRIDIETPFSGNDYIRISDDFADATTSNDKIRSIYFGPTGRMNTESENGGLGGAVPC